VPGSRRLSAGHRPARKQAPAGLIPGCQIGPVSMTVASLSTEHPRFTFVRLPGPHLTSRARLFPVRSPPGISSPGSAGWFEGWSCNPPPEGLPPSLMQPSCCIRSTFLPPASAVHGTLWRGTSEAATVQCSRSSFSHLLKLVGFLCLQVIDNESAAAFILKAMASGDTRRF